MATPKGKTNFKTYEASTRLLAAVIATTGVKLDYAALADTLGGGATAFALQHRLRPVLQLAKMQLAFRKEGKDPGELPVEKGEIQKLFGESTPKGIEWQFRDIKSLGKAQQEAVKKGDNPATVLVAGTPSRRGVAATPGTARTPGTGTRGGRKRKSPPGSAATTLPPVDSSDDNNGADSDVAQIDTPSKRPSKRAATASARKPTTTMTPATAAPASIFGGDARGPAVLQSTEVHDGDNDVQFTGAHEPEYLSWAPKPAAIKKEFGVSANSFLTSVSHGSFDEGDYEDGEI